MTTLDRIRELWPQTPTTGKSPLEIPDTDRWHSLPQLFRDLDFKVGAEIGTERAIYAKRLCVINPQLKLYCIDPWQAYSGYREHVSQPKLDNFYDEAAWRLGPFNAQLVRKFSVDAAKDFKDGSLDFIYIDGNHTLLHVIQDLCAWVPKVRKGGIVAGHDFIRRNNRLRYQCHVVEAVHAYTESFMIDKWYVLGRKKVVEGEKREVVRSFMWIRE